MDYKHNRALTAFARQLRRNMTKEERHLWYDFLKDYPARFYRQKVLGRYIADFYCDAAKLVIELDGSQHFEEDNVLRDEERTRYFAQYGIRVLRIPNDEVTKNFAGVCEAIDLAVRERKTR